MHAFAPNIPKIAEVLGGQGAPDPAKIHVPATMEEAQILFGSMKRKARREHWPEIFRGYDPRRLRKIDVIPLAIRVMFDRVMSRTRYRHVKERVFLAYHPIFGHLGFWQMIQPGLAECVDLFQHKPIKGVVPKCVPQTPEFKHIAGVIGERRTPTARDFEILMDYWLAENTPEQVDDKLAAAEQAKMDHADDQLDQAQLDASEYYFDHLHRHDFNHGRRHKALPALPEKEPEPQMREERKEGYVVKTRVGSRFDLDSANKALERANDLNAGAERRSRELAQRAKAARNGQAVTLNGLGGGRRL